MDNIAVLIPCYNEEKTIEKVVSDFAKKLDKKVDKIYVYDNNSTDKSLSILNSLAKKTSYKNVLVVRKEVRQGKGNVIRRMFREINAKYYVMVDADDTYFAKDLDKIVYELKENGRDMVIGDRLSGAYFTENKRRFHNFGNDLVRKIINVVFKCDIKDVLTGYRGFSYDFVKTFPVLSKGFEIETEMTIHALHYNMNVKAIPISYQDRPKGSESKLNTISDGFKVLFTIFELCEDNKPLTFFGILSLIVALISLIFGVPVIMEYFKTGLVPRFPTLIVCGFLLITALLLLCVGIMLHTIVTLDKRSFEQKLLQNHILFDVVYSVKNNKHTNNDDPFYSKENLKFLNKSIKQFENGKHAIHDLIEV